MCRKFIFFYIRSALRVGYGLDVLTLDLFTVCVQKFKRTHAAILLSWYSALAGACIWSIAERAGGGQQGKEVEGVKVLIRLLFACEMAVSACQTARDKSAAPLSELKREAETALYSI